jgi:hypothetical protein
MIANEIALWDFLEQCWRNPITVDVGNKDDKKKPTPAIIPVAGGDASYGLCRSLVLLNEAKLIDLRTYLAARSRLDEYLKKAKWTGGYLFPLTSDGASRRAALCRQFSDCVLFEIEAQVPTKAKRK